MTDETKQRLPAEIQVELALSRTLLAADRTLLAWIRTSLALFGFGFTLAKFIHGYIHSGAMKGINPDTSKAIGISMIILGFFGLLGGLLEHVRTFRELKMPPRVSMKSPAVFMAVSLALIGMYLAFDIFTGSPP